MAGGVPAGTGGSADHDLLIRIDERVEEIQSNLAKTLDIVMDQGKRLVAVEGRTCPTIPQGILLSRPVAIALAVLVLLVLGGALTLDLPRAEKVLTTAKTLTSGG